MGVNKDQFGERNGKYIFIIFLLNAMIKKKLDLPQKMLKYHSLLNDIVSRIARIIIIKCVIVRVIGIRLGESPERAKTMVPEVRS